MQQPPPPNLFDLMSSCWRCYKQSGGLMSLVYCCLLKKKKEEKQAAVVLLLPLYLPPLCNNYYLHIFFPQFS